MDRVTIIALALLASAFVAGCGDDDDSNPNGQLDAGDGGRLDATIAEGGAEGGSGDSATFPCTSWTAPTANSCGGSHCQDTLAELRAGAASGAVCGGELETNSFCQLEVVNVVSNCTRDSFGNTDPNAIANCAAPQLPGFSSTCLTCFAESGKCASANCFNECGLNPKSTNCDRCRVEKAASVCSTPAPA